MPLPKPQTRITPVPAKIWRRSQFNEEQINVDIANMRQAMWEMQMLLDAMVDRMNGNG